MPTSIYWPSMVSLHFLMVSFCSKCAAPVVCVLEPMFTFLIHQPLEEDQGLEDDWCKAFFRKGFLEEALFHHHIWSSLFLLSHLAEAEFWKAQLRYSPWEVCYPLGTNGSHLSSQSTQEAVIGRITIQGQSRLKKSVRLHLNRVKSQHGNTCLSSQQQWET
jgi:hypothetical protein